MILAIDPGCEQSAFVVYDGGEIVECGKVDNNALLARVYESREAECVIEMVASYGMPVGKEVFDTCVWIGRFLEAYPSTAELVYRCEVKLHICASPKANDATIRQAIIDRFGGKDAAIGKKHSAGPLYGVKADVWQALALAITYDETRRAA